MKGDPFSGDVTALKGEYRGCFGAASGRGASFSSSIVSAI